MVDSPLTVFPIFVFKLTLEFIIRSKVVCVHKYYLRLIIIPVGYFIIYFNSDYSCSSSLDHPVSVPQRSGGAGSSSTIFVPRAMSLYTYVVITFPVQPVV